MTATTPPRSTRRLLLSDSPDVYGRLIAANDAEQVKASALQIVAINWPAMTADELSFDAKAKQLDPDVLRDLIVQDMRCTVNLVITVKSEFDQKGVDEWTVDWKPDPAVSMLHVEPAKSRPLFDAAVAAVQMDKSEWVKGCLHADEPHFSLAVLFGVLHKHHVAKKSVAYTLAVIDAVAVATMLLVNRLKMEINVPRPYGYPGANQYEPLLPKPTTSSYPGGHAAVMSAMVALLPTLIHASDVQMNVLIALADAIVREREQMGLHTSIDSTAGSSLGKVFGEALLSLATVPGGKSFWQSSFRQAQREW